MARYGDAYRQRGGGYGAGDAYFGGGMEGRPGGRGGRFGRGYDRNEGYGAQNAGFESGFGGGAQRRGFGPRGGDYSQNYAQRGYAPGRQQGGQQGRASRMRASEIMTENPETVTPDTTIADAAKKMKALDVGIIPVVESEQSQRLQGVITDRDLAVRALAEGKGGNTQVKTCMSEDLHTVNKNDPVEQVLRIMRRHQVRRVPVVDRENRLVGIIAQADLAVEYGEQDRDRELEVESTIEAISEPAHPQRGGFRGLH